MYHNRVLLPNISDIVGCTSRSEPERRSPLGIKYTGNGHRNVFQHSDITKEGITRVQQNITSCNVLKNIEKYN